MESGKVQRIAFTGHRNARTTNEDLELLVRKFPDSTWVHGGAIGFDKQVAEFCKTHGIPETVIRPEYARHGRGAPLAINIPSSRL